MTAIPSLALKIVGTESPRTANAIGAACEATMKLLGGSQRSMTYDPFVALENHALLTDLADKPKRNLGKLCSDIAADWHRLNADVIRPYCFDATTLRRIIEHFNLAAQIAYSKGELNSAEELCRRAIDICRWSHVPEQSSLLLMLQPHTNLARLARVRGEYDRSLSMFLELFEFYAEGQPLTIRETSYSVTTIRREIAELLEFVQRLLVGDTIKVFIDSRDFDGLYKYSSSMRRHAFFARSEDTIISLLAEGLARALIGLKRSSEGVNVTKDLLQRFSGNDIRYARALLLLADLYLSSGCIAEARSQLERVDRVAGEIGVGVSAGFRFRIALRQMSAGNARSARQHAREALKLAGSSEDEPLIIKSLILLTRLAREHDRIGGDVPWCEKQLMEWIATSEYTAEVNAAHWELRQGGCAVEYLPPLAASGSLRALFDVMMQPTALLG